MPFQRFTGPMFRLNCWRPTVFVWSLAPCHDRARVWFVWCEACFQARADACYSSVLRLRVEPHWMSAPQVRDDSDLGRPACASETPSDRSEWERALSLHLSRRHPKGAQKRPAGARGASQPSQAKVPDEGYAAPCAAGQASQDLAGRPGARARFCTRG